MARRLTPCYTCHHVTIPGQGSQALIITEDTVTSGDHSANVVTNTTQLSCTRLHHTWHTGTRRVFTSRADFSSNTLLGNKLGADTGTKETRNQSLSMNYNFGNTQRSISSRLCLYKYDIISVFQAGPAPHSVAGRYLAAVNSGPKKAGAGVRLTSSGQAVPSVSQTRNLLLIKTGQAEPGRYLDSVDSVDIV